MEYIYAAMLLHKAGKKIDEASVKNVLKAAGVEPNDARVKALVASLEGVNIDEAIQKASVVSVAAAPAAVSESKPHAEGKKEEKPAHDEKKEAESAAAGLSALFG